MTTAHFFNYLFSVLILALCLRVHAQSNSISTSYSKKTPISAEVGYQVHTLPLSGSQMLGPTLMYDISRRSHLGTRYLVSSEESRDQRLSVFWRTSYGSKSIHFIFEPQYSYLWRSSDQSQFSSTGIAGGVNTELGSGWMLGSLIGLEKTGTPFPFGAFWNRPYVIIFTQFGF